MNPSDRHQLGDKIRREVLGDQYVNTALRDWEPARPLLDLVTEFSWGYTWTRDGLSRQTRSLLLVALLAGLNRPAELRLHIGGALRNGCMPEELAEVAIQCAVYAGVPAGIDTMKIIREEVARFDSGDTELGHNA